LGKNEKAKLFAISVDPPDVSKTFADKIASDGKGAVNFALLSDPDHKIIDAYGLRDPAYEGQKVYGIPHPAVYVINKQGKVVWAKVESDYKQRPTNEEIRAALDSLK
jgi:peroxiredoxin